MVPLKMLPPETETGARWPESGSEDLARQSHTLSASRIASSAG